MLVESLPVPASLPPPNAMNGENTTFYDPEFWVLEYHAYRYLGGISTEQLVARYDAIARNMAALASADRDVIPIHSFLSSWYWHRKEHQTRCEFALRQVSLNRELATPGGGLVASAPARPRNPNAGDLLFRYGSNAHLRELIQFGRLRMYAASEFEKIEGDAARQDDECVKHSFAPGQYTTITTEDGHAIRPIGDIKYSVTGVDYFAYCASCDWDEALFDDFAADSCVLIKNPDEFARRMELAASSQLDGWYFHHCPVQYFDPHERRSKEHIDNAMSKDFRFAYQREWRFLFAPFNNLPATGFKTLELGPLNDIAELHARPTTRA